MTATEANFNGATIENTDLSYSEFHEAEFYKTNFKDVNVSGTNFSTATLTPNFAGVWAWEDRKPKLPGTITMDKVTLVNTGVRKKWLAIPLYERPPNPIKMATEELDRLAQKEFDRLVRLAAEKKAREKRLKAASDRLEGGLRR